MTRILIITLLLFSMSFCFAYGANRGDIKFDKDGNFTIQAPGISKITGSLFLWYDDWKYATPSSVEILETNIWKGNMPEANTNYGYISYIQSVKTLPGGGADISLEFNKNGDIQLTRGIFLLIQFPRELSGETLSFTHGSPYITSDAYITSARGFSINLSQSTALEFKSERACIFEHRGNIGEALMNIRLTPNADSKVNISINFKPAINVIPLYQAETTEAKLAIHDVKLSSDKVTRFNILTLSIDLTATYDNFFDPDDLKVDALFTSPSGKKIEMPGFVYQAFKAEYEDDLELLLPDGKPTWKVRFAPKELGTYKFIVNVKDRNGSVKSKEHKFECIDSDSKGFVKISKAIDSKAPLYFQFDNNEPLFIIGHNMPTYYPNVEEYFIKMKENGENYNRFWMYSTALGLEWAQPVGFYRFEEAWKLDKALELASKHGIYIMLCFDTHQDFRDNWEYNPYNSKQGGPCRTPLSFFTDVNAHSLYKKRLRYIVARWSAYTNIIAWEFMNETEGWEGAEKNRGAVTKWKSKMAKFLRKLDPYEHPISSSLWTTEGWSELWKLPEMDFVQSHYYANSEKDMAEQVVKICSQKRNEYPDKLHLFAEYGILSGSGTLENDPDGIHLHNGNWSALMSGCASVPISWWHESYIDPQGLYKVYKGIANFVAQEKDLTQDAWKPIELVSISYITPPEQVTFSDLRINLSGESWKKLETSSFNISNDGKIENVDQIPSLVHGNVHKEFQVPLIFNVDYPTDGKFVLHIGRVGQDGLLKIFLDGNEMASVSLPTGEGLGLYSEYIKQWKRWETVYNTDVSINVPAGNHEIRIQNDGVDWINIEYINLVNYLSNQKPNLRVVGMQTPNKALLWLQNKDRTWFNVRNKKEIIPVKASKIVLSGLNDGEYNIEIWDTRKGIVLKQDTYKAENNILTYEVPEIKDDIAIKIKQKGK